jgi:hypothetical protein
LRVQHSDTVSDDWLTKAKQTVALEHLGDARLGARLRGGNLDQLRRDAERLRREAGMPGNDRPSPEAAMFVYRRRQEAMFRRVFRR